MFERIIFDFLTETGNKSHNNIPLHLPFDFTYQNHTIVSRQKPTYELEESMKMNRDLRLI